MARPCRQRVAARRESAIVSCPPTHRGDRPFGAFLQRDADSACRALSEHLLTSLPRPMHMAAPTCAGPTSRNDMATTRKTTTKKKTNVARAAAKKSTAKKAPPKKAATKKTAAKSRPSTAAKKPYPE